MGLWFLCYIVDNADIKVMFTLLIVNEKDKNQPFPNGDNIYPDYYFKLLMNPNCINT